MWTSPTLKVKAHKCAIAQHTTQCTSLVVAFPAELPFSPPGCTPTLCTDPTQACISLREEKGDQSLSPSERYGNTRGAGSVYKSTSEPTQNIYMASSEKGRPIVGPSQCKAARQALHPVKGSKGTRRNRGKEQTLLLPW